MLSSKRSVKQKAKPTSSKQKRFLKTADMLNASSDWQYLTSDGAWTGGLRRIESSAATALTVGREILASLRMWSKRLTRPSSCISRRLLRLSLYYTHRHTTHRDMHTHQDHTHWHSDTRTQINKHTETTFWFRKHRQLILVCMTMITITETFSKQLSEDGKRCLHTV